jgi:hypothetical protein
VNVPARVEPGALVHIGREGRSQPSQRAPVRSALDQRANLGGIARRERCRGA